MNINDLRAEIARNNLSIPKLAKLIDMNKKTLYKRINGEVSFTQKEILAISRVLNLSPDKIMSIFFAEKVF